MATPPRSSPSGAPTTTVKELSPICSGSTTTLTLTMIHSSSSNHDDDQGSATEAPPSEKELSAAIASRRLFLPSRSSESNSIIDSVEIDFGAAGTGITVPTLSVDPYRDFRRSMEEMVAATEFDLRAHAADLHELLHWYMALNGEHAQEYIVRAFTDVLRQIAADHRCREQRRRS